MSNHSRYQQSDTDESPRFGLLLIALSILMILVGIGTWAAVTFLSGD
ncbi:hypothetical protein [Parachitinimonas caeni]|uniref:Uncharacterized protein n=1 Tax=Parachitinimonas caeni TaxID=3031301 RepID=A0ABT7E3H3_9NEIS|nr:hypothetical protein [Parachitinimonas caeni]MDK2125873.1 hypothetical protein [Parachitinimonas caeni]